jgi:hypothetical protein
MKEDGQLLKNAYKIKDIPGVIVQGRYDVMLVIHPKKLELFMN